MAGRFHIGVSSGLAMAYAAIVAAWAAPALALSSIEAKTDHVSARLVSAVSGTGELTSVPAGIAVTLAGDWKTYWRSPGDAGLPPTLDWNGSRNVDSATLAYPAPMRITVLGIQTFGYKHEVLFPVDIVPKTPGQPLDLKLKLDLLVCAEQCIPESFDLALAIPAGPATSDAEAQSIAKARAAVPGDGRAAGLRILSVEDVSDKGQPALEVKARSDQGFEHPDLIPEIQPEVNLGTPRILLSDDKREATFDLPLSRKLPVGARLTDRRATLTLVDGPRAAEVGTTITPGATAVDVEPGPSLLGMLGVALLGGLILNLMPCVLPVLSLKFFSVVSQGGRAPAAVRAGFLATAAGIIASFLVIAGALIALKAAGRTIGWGLQFQEPGFIAIMAVLVTVFACHLAGLFDVPLPRFIAKAASTRTGPDESLAGHFATGAFATLLATPCSAPFLGTAVGFALAGSPLVMLGIFGALGIGLALPYLAIAAMPQLATRLPRPGRWMMRLKQVLALPLVATAAWLVAILGAQVGPAVALAVAAMLAAIAGVLVWRDRIPETRRAPVSPAVVMIALGAIVLPATISARGKADATHADEIIAWTAFDRDRIRSLVSQGKVVFVDVTADWCLTCQANTRFVLAKDDVAQRLNDATIAMKADWTRPNAEIGTYLASYGRYGIPFNIVYGPAAPGGIVLPELLTAETVNAALDRAQGRKAELAPLGPKRAAAL